MMIKKIFSRFFKKKNQADPKNNVFLFLEGETENLFGLTFHEFLSFDNIELEDNHSWIQWVFPTPEMSDYQYSPPCTLEDVKKKNNPTIKANMRRAYRKIRDFYSLERKDKWLTPGNHNFLRISRILRSLRVFGLNDEADEFFDFLTRLKKENSNIISDKTYEFWTRRNARSI